MPVGVARTCGSFARAQHEQATGRPANNGWIAIAWCVGLIALGYRWSTARFNRDPK